MDIKGSIYVKVGCMFAGKSTYLIQMYRKYSRKYPTVIIKYANDNRYSKTGIGTHDKVIIDENVLISGKDISNMFPFTNDYKVICIEEGQFYRGLVEFCDKLANEGKLVIVTGLDGDANRNEFGEILKLLPKAEKFEKIHAVCEMNNCHNDASFTKLIDGKLGSNSEKIGGSESYIAVCREHYISDNSKIEENY